MSISKIIFLIVLFTSSLQAEERTLTLSPLSFTYHTGISNETHDKLKHALGDGTTTLHFGVNALYKQDYFQGTAWVFTDSFIKPAGGLLAGPRYRFNKYFDIGAVFGLYVREQEGDSKFPFRKHLWGNVEMVPMAAPSFSVTVPITKKYSMESNCMIMYIVNNCQIGFKMQF